MSLLAIIISLCLDHYVPDLQRLRDCGLFHSYRQAADKLTARIPTITPLLAFSIMIFLPAITTAIIQSILDYFSQLLSFLFSITVLVLCITLKTYSEEINAQLTGRTDDQANNSPDGEPQPLSDESFGNLAHRSLVSVNENTFSILFWFLVLGPMGAILAKLSLSSVETNKNNTISPSDGNEHFLLKLLTFLPAHLTALSYAISGSFVDAMHAWNNARSKQKGDWRAYMETTCDQALIQSGLGALGFDAETTTADKHRSIILQSISLVQRSLFVWVIVVALMTLAGWTV